MSTRASTTNDGFINFAATVLAIGGFLNAVQGISAMVNRAFFAEESMIVGYLPAWGVGWLLLGIGQLAAASQLIGREMWGRRLGLFFAGLSIVDSFVSLDAKPIWNLVVIAIDILIIHGLSTHPEAFGPVAKEGSLEPPVKRGSYDVYRPASMTQSMPMLPH
jgi:hypothetical protein